MYQVSQQYLDDISFKINAMNRKLFDFQSAFDIECEYILMMHFTFEKRKNRDS